MNQQVSVLSRSRWLDTVVSTSKAPESSGLTRLEESPPFYTSRAHPVPRQHNVCTSSAGPDALVESSTRETLYNRLQSVPPAEDAEEQTGRSMRMYGEQRKQREDSSIGRSALNPEQLSFWGKHLASRFNETATNDGNSISNTSRNLEMPRPFGLSLYDWAKGLGMLPDQELNRIFYPLSPIEIQTAAGTFETNYSRCSWAGGISAAIQWEQAMHAAIEHHDNCSQSVIRDALGSVVIFLGLIHKYENQTMPEDYATACLYLLLRSVVCCSVAIDNPDCLVEIAHFQGLLDTCILIGAAYVEYLPEMIDDYSLILSGMTEVFARAVREHHAPLIPTDTWSRYFHAMNILDCAFPPTMQRITLEYIQQNNLDEYNVQRRLGTRTDRAAVRGTAVFNASANMAILDHKWHQQMKTPLTDQERSQNWSQYVQAIADLTLTVPDNLRRFIYRSPLSPGILARHHIPPHSQE
ncbi:hypothetical protein SISSUDRAFT_1059136 [Sistotremastrum suecicum HHB10207 ss-3]|uniref:Uncharacterized protein n=1 Tax=Sistotremastrum suecicum HHB10207 ss-3 TaxID=1314776 RepID=A0A166GMJ4_9AGAM|nr:hypothetical protein SISSUDRAFT_1059136 [Sistotremastrum suecicum HHB10207 ss-3]